MSYHTRCTNKGKYVANSTGRKWRFRRIYLGSREPWEESPRIDCVLGRSQPVFIAVVVTIYEVPDQPTDVHTMITIYSTEHISSFTTTSLSNTDI